MHLTDVLGIADSCHIACYVVRMYFDACCLAGPSRSQCRPKETSPHALQDITKHRRVRSTSRPRRLPPGAPALPVHTPRQLRSWSKHCVRASPDSPSPRPQHCLPLLSRPRRRRMTNRPPDLPRPFLQTTYSPPIIPFVISTSLALHPYHPLVSYTSSIVPPFQSPEQRRPASAKTCQRWPRRRALMTFYKSYSSWSSRSHTHISSLPRKHGTFSMYSERIESQASALRPSRRLGRSSASHHRLLSITSRLRRPYVPMS
jgi:hypothetical protein